MSEFDLEECEQMTQCENNDSEEVIENPEFCDKLYKEISKDGNLLISPINVEILLAMAYQGAGGETAGKIATALGVTNQKDASDKYKKVTEKLATINNTNKMFIMKDLSLKNTFENVIVESFKSKIEAIDFGDNKKTCEEINQCFEDKSKIKNVISPDSFNDSAAGLILINALYFKSTWEKPFLEIDTTIQPFFISEKEAVNCEMMFVVGFFKFVHFHTKLQAQVLELPFKGGQFSIILIIGEEYYQERFGNVENNFAKTNLSKIIESDENMKTEKVEVFLPKFKIETTVDLKPLLEKMELETIFDSKTADFSGITENSKSLHVSQFLQKICIEIDNKEEPELPIVPESRENLMARAYRLVLDRPFMYVVQAKGEKSNSVLFVGKVSNPLC